VYPYTLATSSSLAWPLAPSLFAHIAPVYPYTLASSSSLPGLTRRTSRGPSRPAVYSRRGAATSTTRCCTCRMTPSRRWRRACTGGCWVGQCSLNLCNPHWKRLNLSSWDQKMRQCFQIMLSNSTCAATGGGARQGGDGTGAHRSGAGAGQRGGRGGGRAWQISLITSYGWHSTQS
jgi:hypothetical protein